MAGKLIWVTLIRASQHCLKGREIMAFLDNVEKFFGSKNLYAALGVEKTAKDSELRRAYHRLSLRVHPDRVSPEEVAEATEKFQVLGKVYAILADQDKRAIYDEDGTVDEEDSSVFNQDRDWSEYWRLLFKKVTLDDIRAFEKTYKCSDEEAESLKSAYLDCEGDMERILEEVLCASAEDEPRFRELIAQWIAEGSVPAFQAFVGETEKQRKRRKRKHEREAREAEDALREMRGDSNGDQDSLKAMILARQKSREQQASGFFDSLEAKYAKKPRTAKSKDEEASPSKTGKKSQRKGTKKKGPR